jgi:GNAT superfamily N-acetyltransferase
MTRFRVVFYDELNDHSQIATLYQLALNWPATPKVLEILRQNDDRFIPEFGVFAVNNDSLVVGGVFLMEIPSRTLTGDLNVGGLSAVGIKPGYQRKGIMTTLVARCHEYMSDKQLEYSFLTTSRMLGAYTFYKRQGYNDLILLDVAWKLPRDDTKAQNKNMSIINFQEENYNDIYNIFENVTNDSYGFVYRPKSFLNARSDPTSPISPTKKIRLVKKNSEISGYAYWDTGLYNSIAQEILALDKSSFVALLADAEIRFRNKLILIKCGGLIQGEINWLKSVGYNIGVQTYGTVMVRPMIENSKLQYIQTLFGVKEGVFRLGKWDST